MAEKCIETLTKLLQNHDVILQQLLQKNGSSNITSNTAFDLSAQITEFCYDVDSGVFFESWYSRYEQLFKEDGKNLDDSTKVRILLRKIHTSNYEKYSNLILPKSTNDFTFHETVKKLTELFGPKKSLFHRRYECFQLEKNDFEDFTTYGSKVNKLCESFELTKISADEFKSLIFILGLRSSRDKDVRTRLLSKLNDGTLIGIDKLIAECQMLISLKSDANLIEKPSTSKTAVNSVKQTRFVRKNPANPHHGQPENCKPTDKSYRSSSKPRTPCWACGGMHYMKDCQYKNHKCKQCYRIGHKEGYCGCFPSKQPNKISTSMKYNHDKNSVNEIYVNSVDGLQVKRKFITVCINGVSVTLQIDCGSDITIISESMWEHVGKPELSKPASTAHNADKRRLRITGQFECDISFRNVIKSGVCYVAGDINLLGIDFIERFNLWDVPLREVCNHITQDSSSIHSVVSQFSELFNGDLGLCTKTKVKLHLKQGAKPVYRQKRPIAYAALPLVDEELQRLQNLGIITAVEYSDWAAPIVVIKKKEGNVRICADYSTGLNEALQPNQFPLPLPEEIFAKIGNGKIFSHIDLSDAFLQVEVEEDSRKMLTINTHRGLFTFNRLPPGIKSAPGAFQQIMSTMVGDLEGVAAYMDDIIVSGTSKTNHDLHLTNVLQRIKDFGFTLKKEKCKFGMRSVRYLGQVIDKEGLRPDPGKVEAITNMPPPTDLATLQSYLGAINYYGKYIKNMHELRRPMDSLLRKNAVWNWTTDCQRSFNKFKEILKSDLLLTHFDPSLDIVVAADASKSGVGAVIYHRYDDKSVKAICHASRTLTKAETSYGQIEKEALALVFAVTKFHKYIYGRRFTLQTDHKPLLSIFCSKKGIPVYTANRLQRWALTMKMYDFSIEYISTTNFGYADILSRLINEYATSDEEFVIASVQIEDDINQVQEDAIRKLPVTHTMIQRATQESDVIQTVIQHVQTGWPSSANKIDDTNVRSFHKHKDSLYISNECLMYGERLVIPSKYRTRILRQLHKGHQGMQRMKSIARAYVFWPGIDSQIEELVKSCDKCASVAKTPTMTQLESWTTPAGPWQRLHIDYAGPLNSFYFLVVVDAFSKWPEVIATTSITATKTIQLLDSIFARFGLPKTIVSDNGTQFASAQFKLYCDQNGIKHIRTAPYHPQSNGQAERFVDTLKRSLRKNQGEGGLENALQVFLSTYRTTPNHNILMHKSPADLMLAWKVKTPLDLLKPDVNSAKDNDKRRQKQNKQFNDYHKAKNRQFIVGDTVDVKVHEFNKFKWTTGTVKERIGKVMYRILLHESNKTIRSHANQMRFRPRQLLVKEVDSSLPLDVLFPESNHRLFPEQQNLSQQQQLPHQQQTHQLIPNSQEIDENVPTPRRSARERRQPPMFRDFVF